MFALSFLISGGDRPRPAGAVFTGPVPTLQIASRRAPVANA